MAAKWTEKDKKQVKILGIIVAALLVVLVVVLAIPKEKEYTAEETAILSVKYVVNNNYVSGDSKWPDFDEWQVQTGKDSYIVSCTMQTKGTSGVYNDHTIKGLTCYNADTQQWHVTSLVIDGQERIEQK
jgi:hypothetical protein